MRTLFRSNKLINTVITVGAAGLLVGAANAQTAEGTQQRSQDVHQPQTEQTRDQQSSQQQSRDNNATGSSDNFSAADQNQDDILVWTEIWAVHEDELTDAGMNENTTLSTYDTNRDDGLDADEYAVFITDITAYPAQSDRGNQSAGAQPADQQGGADQSQSNRAQSQEQMQNESRQLSDANAQQSETGDANLTNTEGQTTEDTTTERPAVFQQAFIAIIDSGTSPEELQDRTVRNSQGEEIGEVQDVVMSNDGSEAGIVVGVGGILGMGKKEVFLSADELRAGPDGEEIVWESSVGEDSAKNLPEYDEERYTSLAEDA